MALRGLLDPLSLQTAERLSVTGTSGCKNAPCDQSGHMINKGCGVYGGGGKGGGIISVEDQGAQISCRSKRIAAGTPPEWQHVIIIIIVSFVSKKR